MSLMIAGSFGLAGASRGTPVPVAFPYAHATLSLDADGFPPIAVEAAVEVDLGYASGGYVYSLANGQIDGPFQAVQVTSPPGPVFLGAFLANGAGSFGPANGALRGEMTIGPALFCVSSPCEGGAFETVLPFSVVGRGGTSYVSGGQANFTVIGAPWTTATVQVGAETAHGSHATDSRPYWDIAPGFWFRTNLVTPVFISSSLNSYTISAIGRLDLVAFTPRCANGQDDDQDGLADFPDDPGCEHADDLDESLEYRDGASHVLDAAIAEGEDVDVWSLGETPTTLRIVAPAVVPAIVSVQYGGVLHMEGGAIGERIEVEDGGELVVTGGALDRILAMGGSVLVRGTGFDRPYGPILDTFGTLSGTLADGSPVTITLQCDAEATCAIPEPEGAALPAVVATAMLAGLRARASRARGRPRSQ